jgi:hypothetical protein
MVEEMSIRASRPPSCVMTSRVRFRLKIIGRRLVRVIERGSAEVTSRAGRLYMLGTMTSTGRARGWTGRLTCLILQPGKESFRSEWCVCDIEQMRAGARIWLSDKGYEKAEKRQRSTGTMKSLAQDRVRETIGTCSCGALSWTVARSTARRCQSTDHEYALIDRGQHRYSRAKSSKNPQPKM